MGTYHSIAKRRTLGPRKYPSYIETAEILEYAIANPSVPTLQVGVHHGMGRSTLSNWFRPPTMRHLNSKVVKWFNTDDNYQRFIASGRDTTLSPLLLDAINPPAEEFEEDVASVPDVGHDPQLGPTGIGTFVPVTTDDLLVMREEALKVKAEAEAVAIEANVLAIAIDTIRDWLSDKDKLQQVLGRIESLEAQLKAADVIVKRFQEAKLAANQVHSRD